MMSGRRCLQTNLGMGGRVPTYVKKVLLSNLTHTALVVSVQEIQVETILSAAGIFGGFLDKVLRQSRTKTTKKVVSIPKSSYVLWKMPQAVKLCDTKSRFGLAFPYRTNYFCVKLEEDTDPVFKH